ncbi:hypothetical protein EVAR_27305_1 [Eumeta japonica]|uniref:Uncharacterized protein n=1 Tax=Eumeta variegata TaxID=151549 RepID=A0A4C1UDN3_EUMVA|nr:hypothetical protein EVAR_27305_1 [Eumeta japonica]
MLPTPAAPRRPSAVRLSALPSFCFRVAAITQALLLHLEVNAAVTDLLQNKDVSIAARQGLIRVALTAFSNAMEILISETLLYNQIILRSENIINIPSDYGRGVNFPTERQQEAATTTCANYCLLQELAEEIINMQVPQPADRLRKFYQNLCKVTSDSTILT